MKKFGLIGKTLKHSFSKNYFKEKFERENISNCQYELFELPSIDHFQNLIDTHSGDLKGLNVTIPYKKEVMAFLSELDPIAKRIDAVNVIKVLDNGELKGYNSDYYGFRSSLEPWLDSTNISALILGTGGASNAIEKVLEDLEIDFKYVSRSKKKNGYSYNELNENPEIVNQNRLIINCTPLGTFPDVDQKPNISYDAITSNHFLYDLVYNPPTTAFMSAGLQAGAKAKNGKEMLILQAEKSWEIWNG